MELGTTVTISIVAEAETVTVPSVVGLSRDDANDQLSALGFAVKFERQESDVVELDVVIEQSPEANQEANPGADVTLIISSGPAQGTVPQVAGLILSDATLQLGQADFNNINITKEPNADVPADTVIRTDPPSGSQVDLETLINLYVSTGPDMQEVPRLETLAQGAAEFQLRERGFTFRVEQVPVEIGSTQIGQVISQSLAPGTLVPLGTEVVIRVGIEAAPSTQPPDNNDGGGNNN